jgi:hypothetical protein
MITHVCFLKWAIPKTHATRNLDDLGPPILGSRKLLYLYLNLDGGYKPTYTVAEKIPDPAIYLLSFRRNPEPLCCAARNRSSPGFLTLWGGKYRTTAAHINILCTKKLHRNLK